MPAPFAAIRERAANWPSARAFAHRDFRLLWLGAFFSFTGTQVQTVAQQSLVFSLTGSEAKLGLVHFAFLVPMTVFSPFAGVVSDFLDRRKVLVGCMLASAVGPLVLAWLYAQGQLRFEHILLVAFLNGLAGTIEVPTRQSVVRNVVGERDLAAAIPAQAMTFNFARVVGPAVGGQLVVALGPQSCYIVNGCSYFALAAAALAIRADLRATARRREPIGDLLLAGVKYTIRHPGLRTLFVMESATSVFGTFHVALMAAIAKEMLGLGARGLGNAMSAVGIGAVTGLVFLGTVADKPWKARLAGIAMAVLGTGLGLLAWTTSIWVAAPLLAVIGAATIMQFNTTNTLFQLLSPPQLRGRVLSMHIWALSGLAPIGALFFGWLASVSSLRVALMVGSVATLTAATWAFFNRSKIEEPTFDSDPA